MPAFCLSTGLRRFPSVSQAPLLSSRQSHSYPLAVCPLASSLCLPTWTAFSSGNKGGVQFWAVPGSSSPPPLPSPLPWSVAPTPPFPSQADPLVLRGPFPQFHGETRLDFLVSIPLFLTLSPPFLSPMRPLKLHLSGLEAAPLPIV